MQFNRRQERSYSDSDSDSDNFFNKLEQLTKVLSVFRSDKDYSTYTITLKKLDEIKDSITAEMTQYEQGIRALADIKTPGRREQVINQVKHMTAKAFESLGIDKTRLLAAIDKIITLFEANKGGVVTIEAIFEELESLYPNINSNLDANDDDLFETLFAEEKINFAEIISAIALHPNQAHKEIFILQAMILHLPNQINETRAFLKHFHCQDKQAEFCYRLEMDDNDDPSNAFLQLTEAEFQWLKLYPQRLLRAQAEMDAGNEVDYYEYEGIIPRELYESVDKAAIFREVRDHLIELQRQVTPLIRSLKSHAKKGTIQLNAQSKYEDIHAVIHVISEMLTVLEATITIIEPYNVLLLTTGSGALDEIKSWSEYQLQSIAVSMLKFGEERTVAADSAPSKQANAHVFEPMDTIFGLIDYGQTLPKYFDLMTEMLSMQQTHELNWIMTLREQQDASELAQDAKERLVDYRKRTKKVRFKCIYHMLMNSHNLWLRMLDRPESQLDVLKCSLHFALIALHQNQDADAQIFLLRALLLKQNQLAQRLLHNNHCEPFVNDASMVLSLAIQVHTQRMKWKIVNASADAKSDSDFIGAFNSMLRQTSVTNPVTAIFEIVDFYAEHPEFHDNVQIADFLASLLKSLLNQCPLKNTMVWDLDAPNYEPLAMPSYTKAERTVLRAIKAGKLSITDARFNLAKTQKRYHLERIISIEEQIAAAEADDDNNDVAEDLKLEIDDDSAEQDSPQSKRKSCSIM